jgi:hypothetical protein|tara:strand:- start:207 stop:434 length:228 start_codon:yes stop_codon:yes gene_type:complete
MHIEKIGYVGVRKADREEIEEWIDKNDLAFYDSHEDEIVTDVDAKSLLKVGGTFISVDDVYDLILNECDVIKFYY